MFITPHCPQQNGITGWVIRTLKEQSVQRRRFETLENAADWIGFYNYRRPHQAHGIKTPAEAFVLAA
jgi:putative transposase